MTLKKEAKNLLEKYETSPLKRLGQNFLIDKGAINKIITAAELNENEAILEIGPGLGFLTREIASKARKVIAVEKDKKMCELLKEELKSFKNIEIICDDILRLNTKYLSAQTGKIVANLPFYIAAPAIRKLLETNDAWPLSMTLVVQKEVGQRICAKPPEMSILAVSVQFYAEPKIISYVSKKSFWPSPKVDSAIIKLKIKSPEPDIDKDLLFKIVKAGFSQPRKQIAGNLSKKLDLDQMKIKEWLLENNIKPSQRAETLDLKDWINLTKTLQ